MVDRIARVQCLDENGYYMKRDLFLNIYELPDGWSKIFLDKLKDVPSSYTTVKEVLYV